MTKPVMSNGPKKLILIRSGRFDYAEVELRGTLQIVGPNNTGKTTLINTLQFLYLDDRRHMDFGSYTPEQTRDYYFPNQYSYVLFECLGSRGTFVLGWRGQSKAAGGEPERFSYEGPFEASDFLTEQDQVRDPKAVNAKLALKHYAVLRSAQEHRELLLQATKGEGRGAGLVILRDNDKYPQFRETLKNLLCLSAISQDQMRDRLLMLAGLPSEKHALDVRELFGEDYEKILRNKLKLARFKKHQPQIEKLVDACARRDILRGELGWLWTELRTKRTAFELEHGVRVETLRGRALAASEKIQIFQAEVGDRRAEAAARSEAKGGVQTLLQQLAEQGREFADFVEELARTSLRNLEADIRRLEHSLNEAERENRAKAEQKVDLYHSLAEDKRRTIANFDRALITVLRRDLSDEDLSPLARLFNFDLLHLPVGEDGIRIEGREAFIAFLRGLTTRVERDVYRDERISLPLPPSLHSLAQLADPEALRERLVEDEATLNRWKNILTAIVERESIEARLRTCRDEAENLGRRLFRFEQYQHARAEEPRLKRELALIEEAISAAAERIKALEKQTQAEREILVSAEREKLAEENRFNAVMGRFNMCLFPEASGVKVPPPGSLPGDFDATVELFLREQTRLAGVDQEAREGFLSMEAVLGGDFAGFDEAETIRLLREELEALADREDALRRDWEHQLHQLRATFDDVLRSLADIKSAADRLNRAFSGVQVSNLKALRMEVVEQSDLVGSLRRLANVEQPGLFEESTGLEAAVTGFRQKFESNPLLRYADLFTLQFTVTGVDGKSHHYHDFRQVESHGTTITIKVLFHLLVLRSLLREDSTKSLLCEVPFFLDEVHSLDAINRHAILATARKLGFIAITAAPESVSEVDALYFLQPDQGRLVLRNRHRIGVKARAANL